MRTSQLFEEEVYVTHGQLAAFASAIEDMGYKDVDIVQGRAFGRLNEPDGTWNGVRFPCPGEVVWQRDGKFRFTPHDNQLSYRPIVVNDTGSPHNPDPVFDDHRAAAKVAQRIIAATNFTPEDLGLKRVEGFQPCWVPYGSDDLRHADDAYGELGFFYNYDDDTYEAWLLDDDQGPVGRGPDLMAVLKGAVQTLRRKYPSQFQINFDRPQRRRLG